MRLVCILAVTVNPMEYIRVKTHQLWNVHFLNQIIDTMAEGLFTLDDQGQILGIVEMD